jgi:cytoskeletal protein CcmA (bactofilin family)
MKTVIGPETRIAGPLTGKDELEVHGTVDGPVHGEASVTIAAGARIGGEVRGRDVIVGGELAHAVFATGTVRLLATAVLTGDIEAPRVAIDEGAVFDGQIRMRKKAVSSQLSAVSSAAPAPSAAQARAIPELASPGRKTLIRKTS